MMQHLRLKALNFGWVTAEQALRLAIGLFVMTLVARSLGPEGFAAFSYVFALFGLVMPLARFGLSTLLVREATLRPEATGKLLGSGLAIALTLSVTGALLACVLASKLELPSGVNLPLLLIGALFVLSVPGEVYLCYFRMRERLAWFAGPRIIIALIFAILTFVLVMRDEGLFAFTAVRSGEAVLLSLAAFAAFLVMREDGLRQRIDLAEIRLLLKSGLPLMLAGLGMIVLMRVDQILLGQLSSETELGNYGVAVRVAEVANFIPIALHLTLYPAITRNFGRDPANFREYSQRVYDIYLLAAWPAMIGLMLIAWVAIPPVFGAAYAPAVVMTVVLCAATPFYFLLLALTAVLSVEGRLWAPAALNASAALLNIMLNLVFIPKWGGVGAAASTVISLAVMVIIVPIASVRLREDGRNVLRSINPISSVLRLWKSVAI